MNKKQRKKWKRANELLDELKKKHQRRHEEAVDELSRIKAIRRSARRSERYD